MVAEIISAKVAATWVEKLGKTWVKLRKERVKEIGQIGKELLVPINDLPPIFIEPNLQPNNPANDQGAPGLFLEKAFTLLKKFIDESKIGGLGKKYLFLLADAGMGKSSLLAMFKLGHLNSFLEPKYDCLTIKLGPETLESVKTVEEQGNTVLLLDALDEDPEAVGRIKERIEDLLKATQGFYRVIITCRNQFLPLGESEIFPTQDRIKISGFTSSVYYLSPFSDAQVEAYVKKRFPKKWFGWFQKDESHEIVSKLIRVMGDLSCRPLLLSYLDDLMDEPELDSDPGIYAVYKTIVMKWLDREKAKRDADTDKLLMACIYIAWHMDKTGSRTVSKRDIAELVHEHEEIRELSFASIGGTSLLNKNTDDELLFAHRSFLEFLLVFSLEKGFKGSWITLSDMIARFVFEQKELPDMSEINLKGVQLDGLVNVDHAATLRDQGIEYLRKSDLTKAIENFSISLSIAPGAPVTLVKRASTYSRLKQYEKAIADFSEAIPVYLKRHGLLCDRGIAYRALKQYNNAISDFTEAIRFDPEFSRAFYNRGLTYIDLKQYDKAIADFTESIRLDPKPSVPLSSFYHRSAEVYNNRGKAYAKVKQYDKAIADLNEALRLFPQHTLIYYNLACTYSLRDDPRKVFHFFRKALEGDKRKYLARSKTDPDFENMRSHPHFKALIAEFEDK